MIRSNLILDDFIDASRGEVGLSATATRIFGTRTARFVIHYEVADGLASLIQVCRWKVVIFLWPIIVARACLRCKNSLRHRRAGARQVYSILSLCVLQCSAAQPGQ